MKNELKNYFQSKSDIALAYLFGSKASGKDHKLSDFDIGVLLKDNSRDKDTLNYKLELIRELKNCLKKDNIDLIILNSAPPLLKYQVITGGNLLFSADNILPYSYKARVINEYLDIKPMLDFFTGDAVRKIRNA